MSVLLCYLNSFLFLTSGDLHFILISYTTNQVFLGDYSQKMFILSSQSNFWGHKCFIQGLCYLVHKDAMVHHSDYSLAIFSNPLPYFLSFLAKLQHLNLVFGFGFLFFLDLYLY